MRRPIFQQIILGRYLGRHFIQAEGEHANILGAVLKMIAVYF